jgi:hypothetical protein
MIVFPPPPARAGIIISVGFFSKQGVSCRLGSTGIYIFDDDLHVVLPRSKSRGKPFFFFLEWRLPKKKHKNNFTNQITFQFDFS